MEIRSTQLNNTTRVFTVAAPEASPLGRVWGAKFVNGTWVFPGYYPFGRWVLTDLASIAHGARWSDDASALRSDILSHDAAWEAEEVLWRRKVPVLTDVEDDFFAPNFTPYAHQRYGISRIRHWSRTFLLWDMGTGKTRTTLDGMRLLHAEGAFRKALVLGPPVVLPGWRRETGRVSRGGWRATFYDGTDESWEEAQTSQVVCVSYARARIMGNMTVPHPQLGDIPIFAPERSRLLELGYDMIVADESHNLGNWKSEQTQSAIALSAVAARRVALSGTPGDTPEKLYGQLYFLSPSLVPASYEKFVDKYVVRSPHNPVIITGYRNLNEMNAVVDSVASRMKKKDCMDLPPMVVIDLPFHLGVRQQARYNELVAEMKASVEPVFDFLHAAGREDEPGVEEGAEVKAPDTLFVLPHGAARVNKLLQLISGFMIEGVDRSICDACPKMEGCVADKIKPYTRKCVVIQNKPPRKVIRDVENPKRELFKSLLTDILAEDPTNKVLCWGNFDEELNDMEAVCRELGVGHVRLDGETTKNIEEIERRIQEDLDCRVQVGMTSAGVGINEPAANYAIFYSLPWAPLVYQQAIERNNRPGQKRKMTVYRLLTAEGAGALDRLVAGILRFKDRVAFTMTEKITCAACDRMESCALDGTTPFRENCKYAAAVARPLAKVNLL